MTKEDALFFLERFRTKGINEKLYDALGVAIEALNAQPEIIHCENCKYWEGFKKNGFWYFEQCSIIERTASSDDFCSWAERREE